MKLNVSKINASKPKERPYKVSDGGGLFLVVSPTGSKSWRLKYKFADKEKTLSIGLYPIVSLADARKARLEAKTLLSQGVDPSQKKKEEKQKQIITANQLNTFRALAIKWHNTKKSRWTPHHADRIIKQFEQRAFPYIGDMPIEDITSQDVLKVLRKMEAEGLGEATKRLKSNLQRVFTFAIAEGEVANNPVAGLNDALRPQPKVKHMARFAENELPEFYQSLANYKCHPQVKLAFELIAMLFIRTQELRFLKWEYIDNDKKEIHFPEHVMKMRVPHVVPLSKQALSTLDQLAQINGQYDYVFPGLYNPSQPMSENTMIQALYRMGFKGRATVHGFRATASTILNSNGFQSDYIEKQLAHGEPNKVRAAYNDAQYLPERHKMMQWYSDKLETLSKGKSNLIKVNFLQK